jgi:hypothetical protein
MKGCGCVHCSCENSQLGAKILQCKLFVEFMLYKMLKIKHTFKKI